MLCPLCSHANYSCFTTAIKGTTVEFLLSGSTALLSKTARGSLITNNRRSLLQPCPRDDHLTLLHTWFNRQASIRTKSITGFFLSTWHESESSRKLHDPSCGGCALQNSAISVGYGAPASAVAAARHGCQVVGNGEGGTTAHLHGGGRGGYCGLGTGAPWQAGHSEGWLQSVLEGKNDKSLALLASMLKLNGCN